MRTTDRTFQKTHPWITFSVNLKEAPFHLWMDLGAIQSKIEHVANSLLAPDFAKRLHNLYLAKGVHATTAIEGNTLSEQEVRRRIAKKTLLPKSKEYLGREIDNIVKACNRIGKRVFGGDDTRLTTVAIKEFNREILDGLPMDDEVVPGEFRNYSVGVGKYRGAPWEDCPYLVDRLCQWLNDELEPRTPELSVAFAVIRAIMAHLYIAWIHPFGDGNGRTARLVEYQILASGSVPSIAAHLLSNFYNQTRAEYYRQLDLASKSPAGPISFLNYALRGLFDALNQQIEQIRKYQWEVAWRDYVYQAFRGANGPAAERRRLLALELPKIGRAMLPKTLLRRLSPETGVLYANKTIKTYTRDLHELQSMKLVRRVGRMVEANRSILTKLLPSRRRGDVPHPAPPTPSSHDEGE
jgi:Fic family protein